MKIPFTSTRKNKFEARDIDATGNRIYDIVFNDHKAGKQIRAELKFWGKEFRVADFRNQFIKDLNKMTELGELKWFFKKSDLVDGKLKDHVLKALRKAVELEKLINNSGFQTKIKKWMKAKEDIEADDFLKWIEKEENFNKIFEVV